MCLKLYKSSSWVSIGNEICQFDVFLVNHLKNLKNTKPLFDRFNYGRNI
jgi:hypothetical protein